MLPGRAPRRQPVAAVVQGPGWLGLRDAKLYAPTTRPSLAAGFAVLVFDYRGFGDSEGDATYLDPMDPGRRLPQRGHLPRDPPGDRSAARLGAFGSGGTGGGNAIMRRRRSTTGSRRWSARCPIADGRDWLHRMRREHEWLEFLERSAQDRAATRATGEASWSRRATGSWSPRPSAGRRRSRRTSTTGSRRRSQLASAEAIFAYRPIDVVDRIAPRALMLIGVENDATTPEDHAFALYERAGARSGS